MCIWFTSGSVVIMYNIVTSACNVFLFQDRSRKWCIPKIRTVYLPFYYTELGYQDVFKADASLFFGSVVGKGSFSVKLYAK